ncbi:MAG: hypothetical protein HC884_09015 [Chloroflexaceae bacterium]|nr:hypothetical protein [Chloroflexaceae bacterium]
MIAIIPITKQRCRTWSTSGTPRSGQSSVPGSVLCLKQRGRRFAGRTGAGPRAVALQDVAGAQQA